MSISREQGMPLLRRDTKQPAAHEHETTAQNLLPWLQRRLLWRRIALKQALTVAILCCFSFTFSIHSEAQVPDPVLAAQAPVPGAGHHYIGIGAETMNPADGSLSFDLPFTPAAGRGVSVGFGIRFSGTEQFYLSNTPPGGQSVLAWTPNWQYGQAPWQVGAWSYDLPIATARTSVYWTANIPNNGCPNGMCTFQLNVCWGADSYVFRGLDGTQYSLPIATAFPDPNNNNPAFCPTPSNQKSPGNNHGILSYLLDTSEAPPLKVVDQSGTTYQFSGVGGPEPSQPQMNPSMNGALASTITDRNGNQITLSGNSYKDPTGRTAVSWTGIGNSGDTVTVAGLGGNIALQWTTTPVTFSNVTGYNVGSSTCTMSGSGTNVPVVSEIDLPNSTKYTFQYDGTYGKIAKITFPGGGYVRYLWGLNPSAQLTHASWIVGSPTTSYSCDFIFDIPAVTDRYVSFDGTNEVLHQHFKYSTSWSGKSWTSKQTTETSTDLVTGQTTQTTYNYGPVQADNNVYVTQNPYLNQVPVETNVVYQDGAGSTTYKTVNKTWMNAHVMLGEQTIVDSGQGSATQRCYDANEEVTNVFEYGFQNQGAKTTDPSCYSGVSQTGSLNNSAIGPLVRQTTIAYHPFSQWNGSSTPPAAAGTHIVNAPDSVTVADGSGAMAKQTLYAYDENGLQPSGAINLSNPGTTRANITTLQRLISGSNYAKTTYNYYDTGQLYTMTDPGLHTTQYSYTDNPAGGNPFGNSNAYLTQVTYPQTSGVNHIEKFAYDYADGLLTQSVDQNSNPTNYIYNDVLRRVTEIDYPDQGQTEVSYDGDPVPPHITKTVLVNPNLSIITDEYYDGLEHLTKTQLSDSQGADITDTTYDGFGRVHSVSNPHRGGLSPTDGTTYYAYDPLGRTTVVTKQDGNTVQTDYSAFPTVTVTDETRRKRQTITDALGRLTEVIEPNPSSGSLTSGSYPTYYTYNTLGNLTYVNQVGDGSAPRTRSFSYDSLSRLLSAYNPETGTITYSYAPDANCNPGGEELLTKSDARGFSTTYCYDPLHRVLMKSYNGTPATPSANYTYDQVSNGIGRRTGMSDASGQTSWTYDPMGRVSGIQKAVSGSLLPGGTAISKNTGYTYWLDGSPKTITYPSGRVLNYQTDSAGRTFQVSKTDGPSQQEVRYAQVTSFAPQGAPSETEIGNVLVNNTPIGCFNPIFAEFGYNKRLQPLQILYTTSASATAQSEVQNASCSTNSGDLFHKIYSFADSFAGVSGDNGNVAKITSCIDSNRSQNFSYDALNRINTAYTDGPNWGEQFTVDPWANLTNITTTKGMGETLNAPVTALNRLSGWSYDTAGNQTSSSDPLGFAVTNSYDAEGRLTSMVSAGGSSATYTYDGDGNRVLKNLGGTGTLYWGGTDGEILAESDLTGTLISEYVFFNGKRIARTDSPTDPAKASLKYYLSDHLGSTSMITDATFSTVLEDEDYFPYGREVAGGGDDSNHYLFTGKERDAESGNDYFGARYFASSMGRFLSPDAFYHDSQVADPQSWNEYAYARNNPLHYTDPTGKNATVSTTCTTDANNHTTCNVNISASIAIYAVNGSGLSQDQLNGAASTIKSSIESAWSGSFDKDGVTYSVSTQVSVQVAGSESEASKTGAQNVIGLSNGPADLSRNTNALVGPSNSWGTFLRGQDTGTWNYNTLGTDSLNTAAHEFTHLLGVYDKPGEVLSSKKPELETRRATGADLQWGVLEATQSVGLSLGLKNAYNGYYGPLPTPYHFSATDQVGVPSFGWWK